MTEDLIDKLYDAIRNNDVGELTEVIHAHPQLVYALTSDCTERTPLYQAASKGQDSMVEILVDVGNHVIDVHDVYGWTPMHVAASMGHVSTIKLLAKKGSKAIDYREVGDCTPLCIAARAGHANVIETLVRLGSKSIDTRSLYNWTPVHLAASNNHVEAIEMLARLGSQSLNSLTNGEWTPLQVAMHRRHAEATKVLMALCGHRNVVYLDQLGTLIETFQIDEDEIHETRYRVYFSRSLVSQLLFSLSKERRLVPVKRQLVRHPRIEWVQIKRS